MITFRQGNLLDAGTEAVVNTVNTVGVMGKGIALMFKEAFPENFKAYEAACKDKKVQVGKMFVTERRDLMGPRWIINFPTKQHWRNPSKMDWIVVGLEDLKRVVAELGIRSVALPPLGSGNGGLAWPQVRARIEAALGDLAVDVVVYEPTSEYQNVMKRTGVERLTPARALVAELVRRYWILGLECTLLEIQKLAYLLEWSIERTATDNPLNLQFAANKFGPYAQRLTHLLDGLDGSYLHCHKRLADAGPFDVIWFEDDHRDRVAAYLSTADAKPYRSALEATAKLIDGFESPLSMELLATVHWLLNHEGVGSSVDEVRRGLAAWPAGGQEAGARKLRLFDDRLINLALERLGGPQGCNNIGWAPRGY
ncbi:MAG: Appr-1-p processing protein [Azospirillum brasilense]|nr:MAG: Appr-1-p processing protein [Azospirillum brasilense]